MNEHWVTIVGQDLVDALEAEKLTRVKKNGPYFESESLSAWHCELSRRGITGATITPSMYGYSLRYDCGTRDFAIIAGSRMGMLDGSYEDAERYAREWAAKDPSARYVNMRRCEFESRQVAA
jgi:hypothetical protein